MKKTIVMLLTVVFLLSMMSVFANAESYSDDLVSLEVPELFSSKTENNLDGADYIQWTNPKTSANVNITVTENNPKVCYADLSDVQLQAFKSSYVAQLEKEIKDGLEMYSVGFETLESNAESVEIGGAKGLRLDMKIQYIYSDDNVVPADMTVCLFTTDENAIALSGTSKSDEEKQAVESFIQSVTIKGEIYQGGNSSSVAYTVVKIAVILIAVAGIIVIAVSSNKKKKQKLNRTEQTPVQSAENGEKPISSDDAQADSVVYDCSGISPDVLDPDNT